MINIKNTIVYNVDTQYDFIEPTGKLYVVGAEKLKPIFKNIRDFASSNGIRFVSSQDWHGLYTEEISTEPNFVDTFPEHCMAYSTGAKILTESIDENERVYTVDWDRGHTFTNGILDRNIVIRKDKFNVFTGNQNTSGLFDLLVNRMGVENIFVYGVVTEICVSAFVTEILERYKNVSVFLMSDAIMHLNENKAQNLISEWSKNPKFSLVTSKSLFKVLEY